MPCFKDILYFIVITEHFNCIISYVQSCFLKKIKMIPISILCDTILWRGGQGKKSLMKN